MPEARDKVMTAEEAIRTFVADGAHLCIGNYTLGTCTELVHEIARQRRRGFTVYSQSAILDVEVLVGAGCVDRLITSYTMRAGGKAGGSAVERALMAGTLAIEDYTNFEYSARMMAGMHGMTFIQVPEGVMATDLFRKRSFMGEDKYRVITCPFTRRELLTVPAATPDVCIVHVQRADRSGNAQYWGAMGSVAASALASKRIILSCEELVDQEVIRSSPHLTIIPAYRVDAVVEVPWGAHPTEVLGYYGQDVAMYRLFLAADRTADGLAAWMDEWVYGCENRVAYVDRCVQRFGSQALQSLRSKPFYSAPANYGSAFTSYWEADGRHRAMGVTVEQLEMLLRERGRLRE